MKPQKHIVIACKYDLKPDRIGGMDRFFKAYNDSLVARGHKVSWLFSGGEIFDFYSGMVVTLAENSTLESRVFEFLRTQKTVDLMVTHFLELCTPFFKTAKGLGVRSIIAVDHNPRPLNGFPLKKRLRNRLKGILYSRYVDRFVGVSEYTRKHILKDYGPFLRSKTQVIYNGIDTGLYIKRTEPNSGRFIVASHLRASKGLQDLVEAVHQLPEALKAKLHIDIYGEGPLEVALKEKVATLALKDQFSFLGSSANLPSLFHQYSYLLQPTYMECFSLSILESLAANVPVVTTPVGGNPEIIRDRENGFLFLPGNSAQLSAILQKILKGELDLKAEFSKNIEENFPLRKMVADHLELVEL